MKIKKATICFGIACLLLTLLSVAIFAAPAGETAAETIVSAAENAAPIITPPDKVPAISLSDLLAAASYTAGAAIVGFTVMVFFHFRRKRIRSK